MISTCDLESEYYIEKKSKDTEEYWRRSGVETKKRKANQSKPLWYIGFCVRKWITDRFTCVVIMSHEPWVIHTHKCIFTDNRTLVESPAPRWTPLLSPSTNKISHPISLHLIIANIIFNQQYKLQENQILLMRDLLHVYKCFI